MKQTTYYAIRVTAAAVACAAGLLLNETLVVDSGSAWVTQASAVIGRPATPLSYAGVARRTTRRAVTYGAAAGAAAAAAPVVVVPAPVVVAPAPRCYQAVDAYGRIYTRCY
jgi:hypothetical protein